MSVAGTVIPETVETGSELSQPADNRYPQPTTSPNDPLTWSVTRKTVHVLILLALRAVACAGTNTGFSPAPILVETFKFSYSVFDNLAAIVFASMGAWVFLTAPGMFLYGVRWNYLSGMAFGIIGMAWFANVRGASDVYGSQFFCGLSGACSEAAVILSFSQLFYKHQVDILVAVYVLVSIIGMFVGPLVAGYVVDEDGWQWDGYAGLISYAVMFLIVLLCLEETYFDREGYLARSTVIFASSPVENTPDADSNERAGDFSSEKSSPSPAKNADLDKELPKISAATRVTPSSSPHVLDRDPELLVDRPNGLVKRFALITPATNLKGSGFKQYSERLWLILRVFTFPPVLFVGMQWGMQMSWVTYYMTVQSSYWTLPPWNYTTASVGIMFVPTLIGAFLGFLYSIFFVKWMLGYLTRQNGGHLEPEVRLWFLIPGIISSTIGLFIFGAGSQYLWKWPAPYVMLGFIGFGFGTVGDLAMAYCVECYPEMVLESMVGVAFFYDIICCVLSVACSYWLETGIFNTFIAVGVINFVISCLFIPMIFYGKRCRKWTENMYTDFVARRDSLNT